MARPLDKEALFSLANSQYHLLCALVASFTEEQQEGFFAFNERDKTIRDIITHLYEWHQLVLEWLPKNSAGDAVPFLPAPYTWKTYPAMNIQFFEKHQATPLAKAKALLEESHHAVMKLIEPFTDEQLFTKKYYSFTGTTHLASYLISSTSSHYDWAIKTIKKYKKSLK